MRRKFLRTQAGAVKRVPLKWKKPRGIHNKRRHNKKGKAPTVTAGYGRDVAKRGSVKSGLMPIIVSSKEQLKSVDKSKQGIVIAKTGKRKKSEIIAEAEKLGITIINLNVTRYKQRAEEFLKQRKELSKKRLEKVKTKAKDADKETKKKEEKKEEPAAELTDEEKKKQEKEERDKVLTKKM